MIEKYTKYDHLFRHVKPHAIGGIKIFTQNDPYLIEQKYDEVTDEERQIWKRLFEKLIQPLDQYASKEYLLGLQALGLSSDRWPNFSKLSPTIQQASGWQLQPVAGFLNEYLFFQLNAQRKFPVTDIIRQSKRFEQKYADQNIQNRDEYTPEPDIFHDIRGHCPFFMNKEYGDFLAEIGKLGYDIIADKYGWGPELVAHNLKRLQNFAWWSYEFGIMKKQNDSDEYRKTNNDMDHEIYGSGIISSYDEVMNVVHCSRRESSTSLILPFDIEEVVLTRFDYSDIQDRYYVIDSMESLYTTFENNQDLFLFKG
ncbi:hypothetical protein MYX07_02130 [Patescibacteria group bacterium AH-259-L07]|nr:hypothetical protein [Patescibacteria group bacterium AH-259-L07]